MTGRQSERDAARRRLVEQTREFRRRYLGDTATGPAPPDGPPEDLRRAVGGLVKLFQAEVDQLTISTRSAESTLLAVYRRLADVPDPVPVLEESRRLWAKHASLRDIEADNRRLRETLAQYDAELGEVRNQAVTIKTLRERLREYERGIEDHVGRGVRDAERRWREEFALREQALLGENQRMAARLAKHEQHESELRAALETAQVELLELRTASDERISAKTAEIEMLVEDAERANARAATAERSNELLRSELQRREQRNGAAATERPDREDPMSGAAEDQLAAKDAEIRLLLSELQQAQKKQYGANDMHRREVGAPRVGSRLRRRAGRRIPHRAPTQTIALQKRVETLSAELQGLRGVLHAQADYREVKEEVCVGCTRTVAAPSSCSPLAPIPRRLRPAVRSLPS